MRKFVLLALAGVLALGALSSCKKKNDLIDESGETVEGVMIDGITWATRNVGTAGQFVENPWDYGGYFTFEEAQTACPTGWRTPTRNEYDSFGYFVREWTAQNGVNGLRFGSGDHTIFLPAAGGRNTNGSVNSQGIGGQYWSSTAGSSSDGYSLLFSSSGVYPVDPSDYYYGFSVRCVREF